LLGAKPRRRNQIRFLDMFGQKGASLCHRAKTGSGSAAGRFRMTASLSHSAKRQHVFCRPKESFSALARLSLQAEEKAFFFHSSLTGRFDLAARKPLHFLYIC
jgi:hypothetical protein